MESNVKLIDEILLYGSLIIFFLSCISSRNTGFSYNRHILTEVTALFFVIFFVFVFLRPTGTRFVRLG